MCPCVDVFLYSLCVPSGFGGKARYEVSVGHIFPQCVLAAITLTGGGAVDEGARARAKGEPGLLLALTNTLAEKENMRERMNTCLWRILR